MSLLQNDLLTVKEIASYLRVTPNTVYRWCRSEKLQGIKAGKEWRIPRQQLEVFLAGQPDTTAPISLQSLLMGELKAPEHVLVMSGSMEDIYQLQTEFFKMGYEAGHRMFIGLWWQKADEVRKRFTEAGLPITQLEKKGQFSIGSLRAAYDSGGAEAAIDVWRDQVERCGGDVLWGSGSHRLADWGGQEDALLHFETNLDQAFHDLPVIALCPCILDSPTQAGFDALLHLVPHHSGALFTTSENPILMRAMGTAS
jgi:excisionase family DNA binding protein